MVYSSHTVCFIFIWAFQFFFVAGINQFCKFSDVNQIHKNGHLASWFLPYHCSTLYIFDIALGRHEVKYLTRMLQKRDSLQNLFLSRTNLGDNGVLALMPTLTDLVHLKQLDLSENNISSSVIYKLFQHLSNHESLELVNIVGNTLTFEDFLSLESVILSFKNLKEININRVFRNSMGIGNGMRADSGGYAVKILEFISKLNKIKNIHIVHDVPSDYGLEIELAILQGIESSDRKVPSKLSSTIKLKSKKSQSLATFAEKHESSALDRTYIHLDSNIINYSDVYEIIESEISSHYDLFFKSINIVDAQLCSFTAAETKKLSELLTNIGVTDLDTACSISFRNYASYATGLGIEGSVITRMVRCMNIFKCMQNILLGAGHQQFELAESVQTCQRLYYDEVSRKYHEDWISAGRQQDLENPKSEL